MNWMILPFKRYAEFSGRSRRKEYWMFALLNIIVTMVLMIAAFSGLPAINPNDPMALASAFGALFTGLFGMLLGIWILAVIIPSLAVTVRRFHDRDMSGWWYLGFVVAGLIPYIGFIASIALIVLMALPGTNGPNRFGADPKNPSNADVFA
ncbi:DUF805 domain-containing protein [Altericroceibacterium spongiae]|uniref:DUF805 domain-containing protein n=1 Tax=Altericroceibacterium spongiae TaxID=2320269 RepID=A0A420EQK7_9SPHN|nr:DUF805 domain-containing protein [Altericroceibacterium spongiae]RKF22968.1 DUF805 domain-containing protein [Altericroceibacterium spongiae]